MKEFFLVVLLIINFHWEATDFEKAEKLYQQEKYDQAKVIFESYLKSNPNNYKTIEYLGDIAGHQKNGMKQSSNTNY